MDSNILSKEQRAAIGREIEAATSDSELKAKVDRLLAHADAMDQRCAELEAKVKQHRESNLWSSGMESRV